MNKQNETTRQDAVKAFNSAMKELSSGEFQGTGLENRLYEAVENFSEQLALGCGALPCDTWGDYYSGIIDCIEATSKDLRIQYLWKKNGFRPNL